MVERKELFTANDISDLVDGILDKKDERKKELRNCFDRQMREVRQYFIRIAGLAVDIKVGCGFGEDNYVFDFMFMHPHPKLDLPAHDAQIAAIAKKHGAICTRTSADLYSLDVEVKRLLRSPVKGKFIGFLNPGRVQLDFNYSDVRGLAEDLFALYLDLSK